MRNTFKLFGTQSRILCAIALLGVIAFSMVACDSGGGSGLQGGETSATYQSAKDSTNYKLTVTKKTDKAAYAPLLGDTYKLLIIRGGTTQTSSGTVSSYISNVFTLMPANATIAFTIKISGNTIVTINGTITLEGSAGTVQGPGDLQSGSNPPAEGGGGNGTYGDFDYEVNGWSVTITKYKGAGGNVAIPAAIDGKPVTKIGDYAFLASAIYNIDIPNSVTSIGNNAYYGCNSLASVIIPDKRKMTHFTQLQS